jgi:cytochrome c oxidase subunit 2
MVVGVLARTSSLVVVAVVGLAGCGGSASDPPAELSDAAKQGFSLAQDTGCFACHGEAGVGGVAPAWVGLAGSEVELADGSTVTADHEYLVRSISDPGADMVAGPAIAMPPNSLDAAEVDAVVAYIESLTEP